MRIGKTLFIASFCFCLINSANAQNVWRPFSNDSQWNQKIPNGAKTDPNSAQLIDSLACADFYINMEDWSIPVYYIISDSIPKVNVINSRSGIYGRGFAEPNLIPVLPNFIASPPVGENSDNHMCIVDTTKMIEWDMWAARKNKEGNWTTGLGAITDMKSTGVEKPWYEQENEFDAHRSRAGGFPLIAGLIRSEEIKAGKIEHALVFAYQRGLSEFFISPASTAQATFMEMNNRFGIPMGGRIQLDPMINIDTLKLSPAGKIIATALQEYGAFNGDYAGATVLYADNSPRALKEWKGILDKEDLLKVFTPDFVRKHFRVIEMGKLLPGQNLESGQYGFIDYSFDGMQLLKIDWLSRIINIEVDNLIDLSKVKPIFRTVRQNAVVTINNEKQTSGKSIVDFSKIIVYKVIVPGAGEKNWTIEVKNNW
jgi:hypothetical protein